MLGVQIRPLVDALGRPPKNRITAFNTHVGPIKASSDAPSELMLIENY